MSTMSSKVMKTPLDSLMEQARKTWTETITTSVVRSFTATEWDDLVAGFAMAILKHTPEAVVVGFSLSEEQSKMFTTNDIGRLLLSAFREGSLANPSGWVLDESVSLKGAKSLRLPSALFAERLREPRAPRKGLLPLLVNPPGPGKRKAEEIKEKREESPAKKIKIAPPPPPAATATAVPKLVPVTTTTTATPPPVDEYLKLLVKHFYRDYCETQPRGGRDLYPGDVWIRFWYWMNKVTRIPVRDTTFAEFTRCFDKLYPHHIHPLAKSSRRYRGFKVKGLPFIPVYPPVGTGRGSIEEGEEGEEEEDSIMGGSTGS